MEAKELRYPGNFVSFQDVTGKWTLSERAEVFQENSEVLGLISQQSLAQNRDRTRKT